MKHTITPELAHEIDREWSNAGQPRDGLRIVDYRIAGNRTKSMLCVPGDEWAPVYERVSSGFRHVSGPEIRMTNNNYCAIYAITNAGIQLPI